MLASRKQRYTLIYTSLIVAAILCPAYTSSPESSAPSRRKRAVPLIYVGTAVTMFVFRSLVRRYGSAAVAAARVTIRSHDSHSCRGNVGWCRRSCFRHEREDRRYKGVCGSNRCCVSR